MIIDLLQEVGRRLGKKAQALKASLTEMAQQQPEALVEALD